MKIKREGITLPNLIFFLFDFLSIASTLKAICPSFFKKAEDMNLQNSPSIAVFVLSGIDIKSFLPLFFQKGGKYEPAK